MRLSTHAEDRLKEAYGKDIKVQALIKTVEALILRRYICDAKEDGTYIIFPEQGVFVLKDGVIVTFIHIRRIGEFGECERAYHLFCKKLKR